VFKNEEKNTASFLKVVTDYTVFETWMKRTQISSWENVSLVGYDSYLMYEKLW